MTFSITAVDLETNKVGVAIASVFPAVGAVCPWVNEHGGISTQAWDSGADYGEPVLQMLNSGVPLETAAESLITDREGGIGTQLHGVTKDGRSFTYTGEKCNEWAGHVDGGDHTTAGNLLVGPEVVESMSETFGSAEGPLEERLISALEAGEQAGGDKRGDNWSAALLVHAPTPQLYHNLRVDDPGNPIAGLRDGYENAREAESETDRSELEAQWGGPVPDSVSTFRIKY
ncbi:DUF1028 domain-containing protein [Halolamina salifodinae]|uniref:Putative Ntn-hydrolase superfamily protein n=1 Tax=Halolamina salifodinae TaxID=1202767 RepID=A0A8T4GWJ9_9EURY|nr:DUF1028 domain-containing protein [Halolamina salifodinae]MBP1986830.1 putative Ntn-hydrolase superfamily protein [Halolamina salifodinae]